MTTTIARGSTAPSADDEGDGGAVMDLLRHHVPLTLILDLTMPDGPHSRELLRVEGPPRTAWWARD